MWMTLRALSAFAALAALIISGMLSADTNRAAAMAPADDDLDNTGVRFSGPPAEPLSAHAMRKWRAKNAKIKAETSALRSGTSSRCCSPPNRFWIPQAKRMTVHAQNKNYTCGPASVRNMVRVMNKRATGSYRTISEQRIENLLGTTREGTWIEDIATLLNNRWGRYGSWRTKNPAGKWAYLSAVKVVTYWYKQPLIQGVRTDILTYYNGKRLNHFNVVDGYRKVSRGWKIRMMDSWNPRKIYGYTPWYGIPYGHKKDRLAKAFRANDISGNGLRRLVV